MIALLHQEREATHASTLRRHSFDHMSGIGHQFFQEVVSTFTCGNIHRYGSDSHNSGLHKLCRICGEHPSAGGTRNYFTSTAHSVLKAVFYVDIEHDDP